MFILAFSIGIYSYLIFFLGLLGLLYKPIILYVTDFYILLNLLAFFLLYKKQVINCFKFKKEKTINRFITFIFFLLLTEIIINLIGALGPELAFDSLWYHLTLPKLYLINHKIFHIQGGLLYYSDMPKLTEMLYTASIAINSEILAKVIHFLFGILCIIMLYKISRKFFNPLFSLLCVIIFYSSLVVGWESITAYVDLARTFFEIMSLYAWINWYEEKKIKWILASGILTGLAITVKLLALGSLIIFIVLIFLTSLKQKEKLIKGLTLCFVYLISAFIIPLPWLIFSYIHTGNPFFPFFSHLYPVSIIGIKINPLSFLKDIFLLFTRSQDPISPVFVAFTPLILVLFKKMNTLARFIALYSLLALIIWYMTPRTGGGRFILPYLPAFSLLCIWCLKYIKNSKLTYALITFIILISIISIIYRGAANAKYIPVVTGRESKSKFLSDNLNFSFGDFYDTDGYFYKKIKSSDLVLLIGFHNLYYVNFPFIDSSFLKKKNRFNYIATQYANLPKQFYMWKKMYQNSKTGVKLYYKR